MKASEEPNVVPTVSRVLDDTIVELVYDERKQSTALVVCEKGQWTLTRKHSFATGETLVPYSPFNNLIRHKCVLLATRPEDAGTSAELVVDIAHYLHRYVDLSADFERLAAHYVLLTWVFDAFNEVPYLRFKGEFGSGKTRALIALGSIVYKGFFASAASTVSPIFHTLDRFGGTLVLDESDLRFSDKTADLVKILNNGTVKGLPVLRTLQNQNREFNPAAFTVYGPKVVAMRGSFQDEALESRFITESMGQRPLRSDIPIHLPASLKTEAQSLRNRLLHYRLTNLLAVKSDPTRLIEGIDPRLNQTALSLLSLIDDPALRESLSGTLRARHKTSIAPTRVDTLEQRTLVALDHLVASGRHAFIPLADIAEVLNRARPSSVVSAREVASVLRARSLPLYKSNGRVGVPKSAISAAASIRNSPSGGPDTAPHQHAAPGRS